MRRCPLEIGEFNHAYDPSSHAKDVEVDGVI